MRLHTSLQIFSMSQSIILIQFWIFKLITPNAGVQYTGCRNIPQTAEVQHIGYRNMGTGPQIMGSFYAWTPVFNINSV